MTPGASATRPEDVEPHADRLGIRAEARPVRKLDALRADELGERGLGAGHFVLLAISTEHGT